jgi:putative ATP-binding cassette transporter
MIRTEVAGPLAGMFSRQKKDGVSSTPLTPVSSMRSFWGLMRAYWFSDRWKEAWLFTIIIGILTAAGSKAGVWFAEASGELVNAIAYFHDPRNPAPVSLLLSSAAMLVGIVVVKDIAFQGVRHLFSTTLHRKWRGWLNEKFNDALLDQNHTHYHLQHEGREDDGGVRAAPDNIDQRVQDSIKGFTGGAIGLAMGVFGVLTSLYFVGMKLIETSTVVEGLQFLGIYGSAILAFAAVTVYVPLNTWVAMKLGGVLERLTIAIQQAEGTYRGELTVLLRRSFQVAASRGEHVQRKMHADLYQDIDKTWGKLNIVHSGYMSFELIYNFLAARIVAYGPGLLPYMSGNIGLKSYITGAELVSSLIGQCSWFIKVMPEIATLRANARRVTDLADAIETVQRPLDFYRQTGRSDFQFTRQNGVFGLTVRRLELLHEGQTKPFLRADDLRFRRGEWTCLMGPSGCGKTSLMKAINRLWPHGSGDIVLPEGLRIFFATQEVKLPRLTLKQLVCLPDTDENHTDVRVASALHKAGLGDFIEHLDSAGRDSKAWDDVLSGGQKQKLVLSRILLQTPGLLFLDEATGALDPAAKIAFHQALKENCPNTTVISVMHEPEPPRGPDGKDFYHSVVRFQKGMAIKQPIKQAIRELKVVAEQDDGTQPTYFTI